MAKYAGKRGHDLGPLMEQFDIKKRVKCISGI